MKTIDLIFLMFLIMHFYYLYLIHLTLILTLLIATLMLPVLNLFTLSNILSLSISILPPLPTREVRGAPSVVLAAYAQRTH